jgi:hypothetical protein
MLWGGRGSNPRPTDYQTVGSDSSGYCLFSTAAQRIWSSTISGANRAISVDSRSLTVNKRRPGARD